jgi:RNA:NAD 2'-phosphotransferase (TPT1/KptA family)
MQKFIQEDKDCFEKGDKYDVKVLFHGTDERNVDAILRDGLDPSLRKGQSYGQGEYFASSPAMTLTVSFYILNVMFHYKIILT